MEADEPEEEGGALLGSQPSSVGSLLSARTLPRYRRRQGGSDAGVCEKTPHQTCQSMRVRTWPAAVAVSCEIRITKHQAPRAGAGGRGRTARAWRGGGGLAWAAGSGGFLSANWHHRSSDSDDRNAQRRGFVAFADILEPRARLRLRFVLCAATRHPERCFEF
jgi:hypothetical protein